MDRKVILSNPTVTKSGSGGTTNAWTPWGEFWCLFEQGSGFKSDAGSQDNLVSNVDITVRYNQNIGLYLTKDTRATVGERDYQITDYQIDRRQAFVFIKAVGKLSGASTTTPPSTGYVYTSVGASEKSHTVTIGEAGGTTVVLSELIGKTIITIESGRAIPLGIVYTGTPTERQMKFDSATGTLTVPLTAPWVEGEDFRVIYK